jgi:hypothetical protein
MKAIYGLIVLTGMTMALISCERDRLNDLYRSKVEVVINDIPYKTDQFLRIPYTLKMWEYKKEGFVLENIAVIDQESGETLLEMTADEMPLIIKSPLQSNPLMPMDEITDYYTSIQLQVPLAKTPPSHLFHRFTLRDTVKDKIIEFAGAEFEPRLSESPMIIASPVKGRNWVFINQSTNDYHFYMMFFKNGNLFRSERFAFDNVKLGEDLSDIFAGDPRDNESYFNYRDTLYAVGDGRVVQIRDGRPENHGDAQDVKFNSSDEYAGNYLVLDLGQSRYAIYGHCVPNSFFVQTNQLVREGDPLALLGNSGNSTAPHLHFQICDGPDLFESFGVPFVIKRYFKTGVYPDSLNLASPIEYQNSMMEQMTILKFD